MMIVNEDKIMDKINKNLKIIDNLLMENGFYKYISKVVNIEDGISELYDDYKLLQQENERLKDKINMAIEYYEANQQECVIGRNKDDKLIKDYYLPAQCSKKMLDILKEN